MSDLIKLYNPANAASLTQTDLDGLQKLDSPQIKELAKAYPNMVTQRAYLLIVDKTKPIEKQLPSLSTFENLWNLREKNAQRNFVAYSFRGNYKAKNSLPLKAKRIEVLDLSDVELLSLPGFKNNGLTTEGNPKDYYKEMLEVNGVDDTEKISVPVRKIRKVALTESPKKTKSK